MCSIMAWQRISPELTVKGIKKCYILHAMDNNDDDILWNDSEGKRSTLSSKSTVFPGP